MEGPLTPWSVSVNFRTCYVTQGLTPLPLRHISSQKSELPSPLRAWRHLWTSPYTRNKGVVVFLSPYTRNKGVVVFFRCMSVLYMVLYGDQCADRCVYFVITILATYYYWLICIWFCIFCLHLNNIVNFIFVIDRMARQFAIGLARYGCANRPFYHIAVMNRKVIPKQPVDERVIEQIGSYDPLPNKYNEKMVAINYERLRYWISRNAKLSHTVAELLGNQQRSSSSYNMT